MWFEKNCSKMNERKWRRRGEDTVTLYGILSILGESFLRRKGSAWDSGRGAYMAVSRVWIGVSAGSLLSLSGLSHL